MKIEIHANVNVLPSEEVNHVNKKLDAILRKLDTISRGQQESKEREIDMAGELEALGTEVGSVTTVMGSAIVLIDGMAANILALKNDPVKLTEYAASLKSGKEALAAKIFEQTPVNPEPPPVVEASLRSKG